MPPAVPEGSTQNSPLAPSVEKAYYRKCIELKRRLNEVEAANDEAKVRRVRLDRAIQKMRLERAFLLEQLTTRMDGDHEGSEASAEEQVTTPPPDRPHRDKRRKHASSITQPADASARQGPDSSPTQSPSTRIRVDEAERAQAVNGANGMDIDRRAGVVGIPLSAGLRTMEDAGDARRLGAGG